MNTPRATWLGTACLCTLLDSAQIELVKDFGPSNLDPFPKELTASGGLLYFLAYEASTGWEVWKSDGTTNGTALLKDINPGTNGSVFQGNWLTDVGGTLYFTADDGVHGRELWKSDGTDAGTVMVRDLSAGAAESIPAYITDLGNGMVIFSANDGTGTTVWASDGSFGGTVKAYMGLLEPYAMRPIVIDGIAFFSAYSDITNNYALWRSDGTIGGTGLVKDVWPGSTSAGINALTAMDGYFYFTATNGVDGNELWRSDGLSVNTGMVADINPGSGGSDPNSLTRLNDELYFAANDGVNGRSLFKAVTGGGGVEQLTTGIFFTGGFAATNGYIGTAGNTLLFLGYDAAHGVELWTSDGTVAGTVLLTDIVPGPDNSLGELSLFRSVGDSVFFSGYSAATGWELWVSDGTAAGTNLVQDRYATFGDSFFPEELTALGNDLYMRGTTYNLGKELFRLGLNGPVSIARVPHDVGTLSTWPNPAHERFTVHGWPEGPPVRTSLQDMHGRQLPLVAQERQAGTLELSLPEGLAAGVYVLSLLTHDGAIRTLRVVVE